MAIVCFVKHRIKFSLQPVRVSEEFSCGFSPGQNVKGLMLEEPFSVKTNFVENVSCVWGRVLCSSSSQLGKKLGP